MAIPLPQVTPETTPFWQGCNDGVLRYQQCARCRHVQIVPRALCSKCQSNALEWQVSKALGSVASATTVMRPPPAFRERAPYVIALVDMDEGFRLMVNVRDDHEPAIGARVCIGFRREGEQALPEAEIL